MAKDTTIALSLAGEIKEMQYESSPTYEERAAKKDRDANLSTNGKQNEGKPITIMNHAIKKTVTIAPLPFSN
jgi:hypothetical protein